MTPSRDREDALAARFRRLYDVAPPREEFADDLRARLADAVRRPAPKVARRWATRGVGSVLAAAAAIVLLLVVPPSPPVHEAERTQEVATRVYAVDDLLARVPDFSGPTFGLGVDMGYDQDVVTGRGKFFSWRTDGANCFFVPPTVAERVGWSKLIVRGRMAAMRENGFVMGVDRVLLGHLDGPTLAVDSSYNLAAQARKDLRRPVELGREPTDAEVRLRVTQFVGFRKGREIIVLAREPRPAPEGAVAEKIGSTDDAAVIENVRRDYLDRAALAARKIAADGKVPEWKDRLLTDQASRADLIVRGHFGAFEADKHFFMIAEVVHGTLPVKTHRVIVSGRPGDPPRPTWWDGPMLLFLREVKPVEGEVTAAFVGACTVPAEVLVAAHERAILAAIAKGRKDQ